MTIHRERHVEASVGADLATDVHNTSDLPCCVLA
jgi:hypothetical protein